MKFTWRVEQGLRRFFVKFLEPWKSDTLVRKLGDSYQVEIPPALK